MGQLIPIVVEMVMPGDKFKLGVRSLIRMQPAVSPVMHNITAYFHYFFVPIRIIWDDFEDYITGGVNGQDATTMPTWQPTDTALGSLWDYMRMPVGVDPDGFYPNDFPKRAYNQIWNDYYRDETLQTELDITSAEDIQLRNWQKDYFTSSLPWQQRGTAPALPISGTTSAVFAQSRFVDYPASANLQLYGSSPNQYIQSTNGSLLKELFDDNTVDLSSATTFDVADLRLAFQIQRWMERNARAGVRYTEFLKAHFNVSPRDDRLDRPEYIGGHKQPIIVSEVLQTGETGTTPQGNLAGHGISSDTGYVGSYFVQEFGVIMGIMSIMPEAVYQQGVPRQFIQTSKYDWPFPEFMNLSEQPIYQGELFASGVSSENNTVFGYQGRYDEYRHRASAVTGQLRSTLDYWTISRQFSSAPS